MSDALAKAFYARTLEVDRLSKINKELTSALRHVLRWHDQLSDSDLEIARRAVELSEMYNDERA